MEDHTPGPANVGLAVEPTVSQEASSTKRSPLKMPLQAELNKMGQIELRRLVADIQARLNHVENLNVDLRVQLSTIVEERDNLKKKLRDPNESALCNTELKQIYDQLLYKDTRICELNNLILERERKIHDLQEAFSEQGQVVRSKQMAMHIVGKRLKELDGKQCRDASTGTDDEKRSGGSGTEEQQRIVPRRLRNSHSPQRNASPGRAIPQFRLLQGGGGSPPPLDPMAEDGGSSYTTETLNNYFDGGELGSNSSRAPVTKRREQRKKVTFEFEKGDGRQAVVREMERETTPTLPVETRKGIAPIETDYDELLIENDQLRKIISEMEKSSQTSSIETKPSTEECNDKVRYNSAQILKVKAAAQAKVRELESQVLRERLSREKDVAELHSAIDQLKESREWVLAENAKLLDQLTVVKQKCDDLVGELDASLETSAIFRRRLDDGAARMDELWTELHQARVFSQQAIDEKNISVSEIERLKEAIFAQDEFISVLEGDLIVYEAHVGILRDSLGATKKEDRQHIKTKAFAAKLNALEMEKQEIAKRNNEEKLRAKALAVKVRCLEEERDELRGRLRQCERDHGNINKEYREMQLPTDSHSGEQNTVVGNEALQYIREMDEQLLAVNAQLDLTNGEKRDLQSGIAVIEQQLAYLQDNMKMFFNSISRLDLSVAANVPLNSLTGITSIEPDWSIEQLFDGLPAVEDLLNKLLLALNTIAEERDRLFVEKQEYETQMDRQIAQFEAKKRMLAEENQVMRGELAKLEEHLEVAEKQIGQLAHNERELSDQLAEKTNHANIIRDEKAVLGEKKLELEQIVAELKARIVAIENERDLLEEEIQTIKCEQGSLAEALLIERERQARLIALLNDIVQRFRVGGAAFSDASLQDLMENIESKTTLNANLSSPESIDRKSTNTSTNLFRKNVSVQVDNHKATPKKGFEATEVTFDNKFIQTENCEVEKANAEELAEKLINAENRTKSMEEVIRGFESTLDDLQGKLNETELELENAVHRNRELMAAKREEELCASQLNEQLERDADNLKAENKRLSSELAEFQTSKQLKQEKVLTSAQTQSEPVPTSVLDKSTQSGRHSSRQMVDRETQAEEEDCTDQRRLTSSEQQTDVGVPEETVETVAAIDEESGEALLHRQLLLDCIQDRQQFEHGLSENVGQLIELKLELEGAVSVLQAEIWALNEQLKKKFLENNDLVQRLDETEKAVNIAKVQNQALVNKIEQKDNEMDALRREAEIKCSQMQREVQELTTVARQNADRSELLQLRLLKVGTLFADSIKVWRTDLESLRTNHRSLVEQPSHPQNVVRETIIGALEQFAAQQKVERVLPQTSRPKCPKCTTSPLSNLQVDSKVAILAARLVTKTCDNDALVRENDELIETNARLQKELDESKARENKRKQLAVKKRERQQNEDKVENVDMELVLEKESQSKGPVLALMPLVDRISLEADIEVPPLGPQEDMEEKAAATAVVPCDSFMPKTDEQCFRNEGNEWDWDEENDNESQQLTTEWDENVEIEHAEGEDNQVEKNTGWNWNEAEGEDKNIGEAVQEQQELGEEWKWGEEGQQAAQREEEEETDEGQEAVGDGWTSWGEEGHQKGVQPKNVEGADLMETTDGALSDAWAWKEREEIHHCTALPSGQKESKQDSPTVAVIPEDDEMKEVDGRQLPKGQVGVGKFLDNLVDWAWGDGK